MKILQVIGSATDEFIFKVSWILAKNCPIDVLPEEDVEYDYVIYVPAPSECSNNGTPNGHPQEKPNAIVAAEVCWFFISGEKQRKRLPDGSKLLLDGLEDNLFWFSTRPVNSNRRSPRRHPDLPEHIQGPLTLAGVLAVMKEDYQLMIPHGFDFPSMTTFRSLFENVLGIPHPGPTGLANAVLQNKVLSRSVLATVPGLNIPKGEVLTKTTWEKNGSFPQISIPLPFVVKPAQQDNSIGVSLCRNDDEVLPAVKEAFKHGDQIIIEEFIPGREIRAGGIEDSSGKCRALSCKIEYGLSEDYPIRVAQEKLFQKVDDDENNSSLIVRQVSCDREFLTSNPGSQNVPLLAPEIAERIDRAVCKAHEALKCRDYSMFDFRIHEETGEPYILESCSFWAYSPFSVLSLILNRSTELFLTEDESSYDPECWRRESEVVWTRAINRGRTSERRLGL